MNKKFLLLTTIFAILPSMIFASSNIYFETFESIAKVASELKEKGNPSIQYKKSLVNQMDFETILLEGKDPDSQNQCTIIINKYSFLYVGVEELGRCISLNSLNPEKNGCNESLGAAFPEETTDSYLIENSPSITQIQQMRATHFLNFLAGSDSAILEMNDHKIIARVRFDTAILKEAAILNMDTFPSDSMTCVFEF